MPLFVGAEFRPVKPKQVAEVVGRIIVWLAEEIDPSGAVWWSGQQCQLEVVPPIWPRQIYAERPDGSLVEVLHRAEVRGRLQVVIEGTEAVTLRGENGEEISHRFISPTDCATELRSQRTPIPWTGESNIHVAALPETPILLADNGVRWSWSEGTGGRRRKNGVWVQLLAPDEVDLESTIDARSAFCDEGIREVKAQEAGRPGRFQTFRVLGFG
jgi:hypothetical protein